MQRWFRVSSREVTSCKNMYVKTFELKGTQSKAILNTAMHGILSTITQLPNHDNTVNCLMHHYMSTIASVT